IFAHLGGRRAVEDEPDAENDRGHDRPDDDEKRRRQYRAKFHGPTLAVLATAGDRLRDGAKTTCASRMTWSGGLTMSNPSISCVIARNTASTLTSPALGA